MLGRLVDFNLRSEIMARDIDKSVEIHTCFMVHCAVNKFLDSAVYVGVTGHLSDFVRQVFVWLTRF